MLEIKNKLFTICIFFCIVQSKLIFSSPNQPVDESAGGGKEYRKIYKEANQFIWNNRATNPYKSIEKARQLLKISDSNNDERGKAETLNYLGLALFYVHNLSPAFDTLNLALKIATKYNDSTTMGFAYNNLGACYSRKNLYADATSHILTAIQIFANIKDSLSQSYCLISLGIMYSLESEHDKALACYKRAERIREKEKNPERLARIYSCLADAYFVQNKVDSAMVYFQKVEALYPQIDSTFHDAMLLATMATYQLQQKNYTEAKQSAYRALEKTSRYSNHEEQIRVLRIIADIYIAEKHYALATENSKNALHLASIVGSQPQILECYEQLGRIYEYSKQYQQAVMYKNMALELEKSNFKTVRLRDISALTATQEARKKEYENILLKKNNELQTKELQKRTYLAIILLITLSLGSIAFIALSWMFRNRTKVNLEIQAQKAELELLNTKLIEANKTKDKFFSIIAHDLKNPFNTLLNVSQMLLEDFDSISKEEEKQYIKSFYEASYNTYQLLSNLLEWATAQTGRIAVEKRTIAITQITQSLFPLLEEMASRKNVSLISNASETVTLHTDKEMLTTILRNLLTNSIKFSNEGGSIQFNVSVLQNSVVIQIIDSGIGMSEEILTSLFSLDKKVQRTGTANENGTGLGLILCKEFIEALGGTISVQSKVGYGTTFILDLPQ